MVPLVAIQAGAAVRAAATAFLTAEAGAGAGIAGPVIAALLPYYRNPTKVGTKRRDAKQDTHKRTLSVIRY